MARDNGSSYIFGDLARMGSRQRIYHSRGALFIPTQQILSVIVPQYTLKAVDAGT